MNTEIADQILDLILNRFVINNREKVVEQIRSCPDIYSVPLTGELFGMNGTELVYLYFEIQKMFHVHFDARQVCNYEFMTICGITRLIEAATKDNF